MYNIDNLPYEPGDIVRDRKTDSDYVIQSISALAGLSAAAIYGVNLWNDKVETWTARSATEMSDTHILIRKGAVRDPNFTIQHYRNRFNEILKHQSELYKELIKEENVALRDLLYLGLEGPGDDPNTWVPKSFAKIAKSLVTVGGGIPTKDALKSALMEIMANELSAGTITEDAITMMASNIETYARVNGGKKRFLTDSNTIKGLLLDVEGKLNGPGLGLIEQAPVDDAILDSTVRKWILGESASDIALNPRKLTGKGNLFSGLGKRNLSQADRVTTLLKNLFGSKTGGKISTEIEQAISENIGDIVKILNNQQVSSRRAASAKPFVEGLVSWLTKGQDTKEFRMYVSAKLAAKAADPGLFMQGRRLDKIRARDPEKSNLRSAFSRGTGIRRRSFRNRSIYRTASLENLYQHVKNGRAAAVNKNAFFTGVVGKIKLKLATVEGPLNNAKVLEQMLKSTAHPDDFILINETSLQLIKEAREAGDSGVLDMDKIFNESNMIRKGLTPETLSLLEDPTTFSTPEEGVARTKRYLDRASWIGLEPTQPIAGKSGTLYHLTSDVRSIYTTNAERAAEILSGSKDYSLQIYSGLEDSALFDRIAKSENSTIYEDSIDNIVQDSLSKARSKITFNQDRSLGTQSKSEILKAISEQAAELNAQSAYTAGISREGGLTAIELRKELITAFDQGYLEGKTAFARVIRKDGDKLVEKIRLIGGDVDATINVQLERALKFFDAMHNKDGKKAAILDIENLNIRNSEGELTGARSRQISLKIGDEHISYEDVDLKTDKQRFNVIADIAERLERGIGSGEIDVVGTTTGHDFRALEKEAAYALELIDTLEMAGAEKQTLKGRLMKAVETFRKIRFEHHFDLQTVFGVTNFDMGTASQSFVTKELLKRRQIHTAKQDVADAWDIAKELEAPFRRFMDQKNGPILTNAELPKANLFIIPDSQMGARSPTIYKILGLGTSIDPERSDVARTGIRLDRKSVV